MGIKLRHVLLIYGLIWLTSFAAWAQNDTIPPQDGFNEDQSSVTSEPDAEPTSTKKAVGDRSPFRNRRFKPKYGIRKFLNKFTFTPVTGYSKTYYKEDAPNTEIATEFKGSGIPLAGTLNFHVDRFRIGGGAGLEFHSIKDDQIALSQGIINKKSTIFSRYYGNIGAEVYQYWDYMLVPELQVGKLKLGKGFNQDSVTSGLFVNLGVSVEKVMSEYFRVVLKPSYEFRSLEKTGPEGGKYKMPGLTVQLGFSIRYPDLPRCPIRACQTQIKHIHYGNEYRGQPLPIKQYRKYGELNPKLLKYKRKNKRKLNPY